MTSVLVSPGGLAALSDPGEQGWASGSSAVLLGTERLTSSLEDPSLSPGPWAETLPLPPEMPQRPLGGAGFGFSSLIEVCVL